jgi:trigger factor
MEIRIEDAGPCRRALLIKAPPERVAPEYDDVLKVYAASARVPGFRPGRAPRNVVERHYAKHIAEDARDRLVPVLYREALAEKGIAPVAIVDVRDVSFDRREGLTFQVMIDVPPDFKLPRYRKIALKTQAVDVSDEEVDRAFGQVLESYARYKDVEGRPVRDGDLIRIDYTGTMDGKPIVLPESAPAGLAENRDFWFLCGGTELVPGLGRELIGAVAGETREAAILFPADFRVKTLAGREARYTVTVYGIREKVLPERDAEFWKQFEVESEAGMKDRMRSEMLARKETEEQGRLKSEIARFLLDKTEFDLPQSVVDQETNLTIRSIVNRIVSQGATREQLEAQQSAIYNSAVETSRERVKLAYILSRIADEEEIRVEESEVNARLDAMAARYGLSVERLRAEIEKRNGLENLESDIRSDKTLTRLLELAKIKKG